MVRQEKMVSQANVDPKENQELLETTDTLERT